MSYPDNLKYTKDHEWIKTEGNEAYIGITEYAQNELGDIVFVEVDTVGESLNKGDTFGTIEAVKTVSDLFLPVSGEILELNPEIESDPELINKDPYGKGWIIKIKVNDSGELGELLDVEQYKKIIEA